MKATLKTSVHLFFFLGIVFIPSSSYLLGFQDQLATLFFGDLINLLIADHLDFGSDTLGLNVLCIVLLFLSFCLAILLERWSVWKKNREQLTRILQLMMVYYLSSRLLVYGFDKVFQTQFYLPEPNTLFTPLGYLSKDILFWSAMGTSKWYCILSGIAEIIPALLLLFSRSRLLGLLLAFFVLLHVLIINIGFDISVKLYALFLLAICCFLLQPYFKALYQFFIEQKAVQLPKSVALFENRTPLRKGLKVFIIGLLFIEALKFPISTGLLNDRQLPKPALHGAYEVIGVESSYGVPQPNDTQLKRVFIHRRNFLIFQFSDDRMIDYPLIVDQENNFLRIETPAAGMNKFPYQLYGKENSLKIGMSFESLPMRWFITKRINLNKLPALQDSFHWTIDEYAGEK